MDLLDLHARLETWQDRSAFAVDCTIGSVDAWAAAATAAVDLAGYLADLAPDASDDAIRDALAHARTLYDIGILTDDRLREATGEVVAHLLRWGDSLDLHDELAQVPA